MVMRPVVPLIEKDGCVKESGHGTASIKLTLAPRSKMWRKGNDRCRAAKYEIVRRSEISVT